ncbi:type II toxin-antitoxin system death-on-curing family toxin [Campylobacter ureolyticus]|uniref:type II toxin-antitoxin system death-on-curing family toxin n=1 Tax=Campylobacter ureolyticus TaxID=827 RepID=UPI001FC80722|nr:type II toxin-antitoxin system death-on-curing family toxin [Campylobacter ureolyticus]MCZ6104890.1 type II toxin-antitoxin system death-on-curing family toxin [Campylobacter ureolyticus]MCZ6157505.1 type II toxin-antitoxin system death-on-curing family toxin [Campylobacter ureolyticus]GKH60123.1 hypothetical protein CE91St25_04590 [Campylobacter ureolyticus]
MNYLEIKQVISLHDDIMDEIDGLKGYNKTQANYLEASLEHITNNEYYLTFYDKLAHLIYSIIKFHPFYNGNKAVAIYTGMAFMLINKSDIANNDFLIHNFYAKMENATTKIAKNEITKDDLTQILIEILKGTGFEKF